MTPNRELCQIGSQSIWQAYYKVVKSLFPLHICRPNDYTAEI